MAEQGSSLPTTTSSTTTSPADAVLHDNSTPSQPPPPPSSSTNDATDTVDVDGTISATTAEAPDPATNDGSTSSAPAPPPPVPPSSNDDTITSTQDGTSTTDGANATPTSPAPSDPLMKIYDVRYQNAWRVDRSLEEVLPVLAAFAKAAIKEAHTKLLATKSTSEPGAVTLNALSPCSEHHRSPGDGRFRLATLRRCDLCKPWVEALGAVHASGNANKLNADNMYPNMWHDVSAGPWSIATIFTRAGIADDVDHADATCLINIMLFYKLAFPDLTTDDHNRLKAIQTVRNDLAHLSVKKLPREDTVEYIDACVKLLKEGPWTKPPFKEATEAAVEHVLAWRDRPMELLPQLEQLEPHFVPQRALLDHLAQALTSHRVVALSGLGGIGKSTTALAHAWQLARSGACPGRHGVLWGSAADDEGGMAAALANIVQGQLGMHLSAAEAANDAVVRRRLQGWAAGRSEPWLLVLDNVEPGTKEKGVMALLGDHGSALVTTRAGPNALYRDMGLPRAAVLRLECLAPEDGYTLLMARYRSSQRSTSSSAAALSSAEESAARELVGEKGVAGLPLAVVQAAALVATTPGQTFVEYLKLFQALSPGGVTTQLPGDDGGSLDVARELAALLTACGLQDVEGLLDRVVAVCKSLDDVQWLEAEDVGLAAGAGAAPSAVQPLQRRRWRAFKKRCKEAGVAARHEATVATVWATQLKVLPGYCVELLRGASCCAPEHIPQSLFVEALRRWVEASKASEEGWLASFAGSSALVAEVAKRSGDLAIEAVVEDAAKWLEDLSLVHRGVWASAGDIHPQLAVGALREAAAGGGEQQETAATGGAGQGAGAGPHTSTNSSASRARPWFSMHRLVQGVVFGSEPAAAAALGQAALAGLQPTLRVAVRSIKSVLSGAGGTGSVSVGDMELAAWLAAHGHGVQLAQGVTANDRVAGDASDGAAGTTEAMVQFVRAVEGLSQLVTELGLFRSGDAWCRALEATTARVKLLAGGSDSSDVAESLSYLAFLYEAQSRYGEAEPLYVQALAMDQRLHSDSDSSAVANSLNNLASLYKAQSRYAEAEPLYVQALAMEQRLHGGSDNSAVARALNNLANLYQAQSRYDEAEPLYVQSLAMKQRLHGGSDSSAVASSLNNLAGLYEAQSRYDEAEPLYAQALAMEQRLHGDSDSSAVATALGNLAGLYEAQSRYAEAEPLHVQALAMEQRLHAGRNSSAVARALNNLALLYEAQSRCDEAEPLLVQALAMEQRLHGGSDSSAVASALNNLAMLYKAQSRYAEAEPLYVQALAMKQRLHGGSDSSDVATSLNNLAGLYHAQSRHVEAEPLLVQALAMVQRLHGDRDSSAVATALNNLAALYYHQQNYKKAATSLSKAIAILRRVHNGADHRTLALYLSNLAVIQAKQGNDSEAAATRLEAQHMHERLRSKTSSSSS